MLTAFPSSLASIVYCFNTLNFPAKSGNISVSENPKKGDLMASKVSWKKDKRLQRILKQNAERRDEERSKKNKGWDTALTVIFLLGFFLFGMAWLVIGVAKVVILVSVGILAGIIASYVV